MAAIRLSKHQIACISKENILVFDLRTQEKHVYRSEKPKTSDEAEKKQLQGNEEGSCTVLACGFSPSGRYFVSCDDYKQLTTWQIPESGAWQLLSTRSLQRRATTLTFTQDDSAVLVGDKSGDVYGFPTSAPDREGELLMGHVSMLLDMVLCDGDRLLATSDRDEKIRVSHYPNAHSIHSYCLGHTDFVSCLGYFPAKEILVSGSGDGTIRLWDYKSGDEVTSTQCRPHLEAELAATQPPSTVQPSDPTGTNSGPQKPDVDLKAARRRAMEAQGVDVKCLSCCRQRGLVAVGFDRLPVVLIFKAQFTTPMTLTFVMKVTLDGPLWDLTFDPEGRLLVLQANESRPALVFEYGEADEQMKVMTENTDNSEDNIIKTVAAINKEWDTLKGSVEQQGIFSVLHKVRVDNAKLYLEQKEKKLDEQKQRYKNKQERRKRGKDVLPPGDCQQKQSDNLDNNVAPPSEWKKAKNDS